MARRYRLRDATPRDREPLYALHCAAMGAYIRRIWGWDESVQRRYFDAWFRSRRVQIVVVDGCDAGILDVLRGDDEIYLSRIEIHPGFQRHGVGAAIVRDLLEEAAALRVPLTLHVFKVNPARRLYERLGFEVRAEEPDRYFMRADPADPPFRRLGPRLSA
jgi:ribosomal protein S18 acetylase RimI-like enzyme